MAIPLVGVIIGAASSIVTWVITRIIAIFGIGFISILGVKPLLNQVANLIRNMLNINTPDWFPIFQWAGVLQLDVCASIWLSAISAKLLLSGLNAKTGSMKKMRVGGAD